MGGNTKDLSDTVELSIKEKEEGVKSKQTFCLKDKTIVNRKTQVREQASNLSSNAEWYHCPDFYSIYCLCQSLQPSAKYDIFPFYS